MKFFCICLVAAIINNVDAFVVRSPTTTRPQTSSLTMVSRQEYLKPRFQVLERSVPEKLTKTTETDISIESADSTLQDIPTLDSKDDEQRFFVTEADFRTEIPPIKPRTSKTTTTPAKAGAAGATEVTKNHCDIDFIECTKLLRSKNIRRKPKGRERERIQVDFYRETSMVDRELDRRVCSSSFAGLSVRLANW